MAVRVALFGGTFDPIHNGHIELALAFAQRLHLDKVLLMPTFVPPHKLKTDLAPAADRLAMCRLAAAPYPVLEVSDLEIARGGASFTVDTLSALAARYPGAALFLLMGADMFLTVGTWYRFADIARLAVLCVTPRDGVSSEELRAYAQGLEAYGARCVIEEIPLPAISSTDIRRRAGDGLSGLVPPAVEAYIQEHRLYTSAAPRDLEDQYRAILKGRLTPKRYQHSLAVADRAAFLARRYGADEGKAHTAGLLHDILKDAAPDAQLQMCQEFGILLTTLEKRSDAVLHAMTGAAFLQHILGITDEEVLLAVRYHTTGRAGMTLLEKVVYLADLTSSDRQYPDVETMRALSEKDLDEALLYGVSYTLRERVAGQKPVHPDSLALYNEVVLRLSDKGQKG